MGELYYANSFVNIRDKLYSNNEGNNKVRLQTKCNWVNENGISNYAFYEKRNLSVYIDNYYRCLFKGI